MAKAPLVNAKGREINPNYDVNRKLIARALATGASIGTRGRLQMGGERIELTKAIVKQLEKNAKQNAKRGNPSSPYTTDASGIEGGRDPKFYTDDGSGGMFVPGPGGTAAPSVYDKITGPSIADDEAYQKALAALGKSGALFASGIGDQKAQFNLEYADSLKRLGYNPETNEFDYGPDSDYGKDFSANQGDFASRGTYWSGPRLGAETTMRNNYIDRGASMKRAKDSYFKQLDNQLALQQAQNEALKQDAYQAALDRQLNNIATGGSVAPGSSLYATSLIPTPTSGDRKIKNLSTGRI